MVQQFGRVLEQGLQKTWKYLTTDPNIRRMVIRMLAKPNTQKTIVKGVQHIWEELSSSISLKIDLRKKEAEFIINVHKEYYVGTANNSTIIQGENISQNVNDIQISINIALIQDVTILEKYCEQLNKTKKQLNFIVVNPEFESHEQLKNIDNKVNIIGQQIENFISQITDYKSLQKALETAK